jgi:drug/metabolite transporter (DMT)-like permease
MVHAVLFLVQVLFATLAIAAKLALRDLPPAGLVLLRVSGAALAFALLQRLSRLPGVQRRSDFARLALYSLLGVVANQLLYVQGLSYTTAINANILITTVPVFTFGVALALGREKASSAKVTGLLLAMAGALLLVGAGGLDVGARHKLGNVMILLNALSYAIYLVISKDLLRRYPALTVITWVFAFGAAGVLPFGLPALAGADLGAVRPVTWLVVLYIVLVPTTAVYWLSLWALHRTDSSLVAIYVYVQPVVTALVAPAVLGERLGVSAVLGGAMIFAGIALVTLSRRRRLPEEEALPETVE